MRQTQKFQLILACSALLFCLSPIANRWLPMHAHTPVHYAARVEDRGGPPLPLIADELGSMRWVRTATGHEDVQIYAISAKSDRLYAPLAQALATAAPVKQPAQGVTFPYLCYFYSKAGVLVSTYRLSATGLVEDLQSGHFYQPAAPFPDVVQAVVHAKESAS